MYLVQNSVVFIVVFFFNGYISKVVKSSNITLRDLEGKENTTLLLRELDTVLNVTYESDKENMRTKIKRWEQEIYAVGQTLRMPGKKMLALYTQFWIDLLSPSEETAGYAPRFIEMCKKLFLQLKSY